MLKERSTEALEDAELYFVKVIETQFEGNAVPSRTEEMVDAVKGLMKIVKTRCMLAMEAAHAEHKSEMKMSIYK